MKHCTSGAGYGPLAVTLAAQIALRDADLARVRSELARAQGDVDRRAPLLATGAVGREAFNHAAPRAVRGKRDRSNATAMQTLDQLGAAGYSPAQALAFVDRLVGQQASTLAATDIFFLSSMLFLTLLVLVWSTRRQRLPAGAEVGGAH